MDTPRTTTRSKSRAWVGYFVLLLVLVLAAVTIPIVWNLGQQLRPEQLAAAREKWRANAPADYDLVFSIKYDREQTAERHIVLVRGGKIVFASCEGEVQWTGPAMGALVGLPLGGVREARRDIPAIFDHIESLLAEEQTAARRSFLVAVFDPVRGYPRRFVRRIQRSSTREAWDLLLWEPGEVERRSRR